MKTTFATLALCAGANPLFAQQTEADCTALRDVVFGGGYVTSARSVAAQDTLPAYCEVRATALPAISIEVRLPLENWNGKYYQAGCGGFCGILGRADAGFRCEARRHLGRSRKVDLRLDTGRFHCVQISRGRPEELSRAKREVQLVPVDVRDHDADLTFQAIEGFIPTRFLPHHVLGISPVLRNALAEVA